MKRYLVFAGDCYYPGGGWEDFRGDHATVDDAFNAARMAGDWWHVVDMETRAIVSDPQETAP